MSDSAGEWFEVTNTSSRSVDVAGLQLRDLANTVATVSDHVVLAAGAYYGTSLSLNNSGEQLWLVANGVDIDSTPTITATAGAAGQRDPSSGAWCVATTSWTGGDKGTPGTANVACR